MNIKQSTAMTAAAAQCHRQQLASCANYQQPSGGGGVVVGAGARVSSWPLCCILINIFINTAHTLRLLPCELAGQLYILDVPKAELPLWLCIAEYESRFNTDAIGSRNLDGSLDYGIFQISDRFWCQPQHSKVDYYSFNECLVNCTNLVLDDITEAVRCAKLIRKQQGWSAWTVYEEFCNDTLPDIEHCFS